jgi:hypothetical protein
MCIGTTVPLERGHWRFTTPSQGFEFIISPRIDPSVPSYNILHPILALMVNR